MTHYVYDPSDPYPYRTYRDECVKGDIADVSAAFPPMPSPIPKGGTSFRPAIIDLDCEIRGRFYIVCQDPNHAAYIIESVDNPRHLTRLNYWAMYEYAKLVRNAHWESREISDADRELERERTRLDRAARFAEAGVPDPDPNWEPPKRSVRGSIEGRVSDLIGCTLPPGSPTYPSWAEPIYAATANADQERCALKGRPGTLPTWEPVAVDRDEVDGVLVLCWDQWQRCYPLHDGPYVQSENFVVMLWPMTAEHRDRCLALVGE